MNQQHPPSPSPADPGSPGAPGAPGAPGSPGGSPPRPTPQPKKGMPTGGLVALIVGIVCIGGAIIFGVLIVALMPALSNARDAARQTVETSNLRMINMTMLTYAIDNNGRWPEDFAPVFQGGYMDGNQTDVFISPLGPHGQEAIFDSPDPHAPAYRFGDFVFIRMPADLFMSSEMNDYVVIFSAYTSPRSGNRNVAFPDGTVMALSSHEFERALEKTNEIRESRDLPPVDLQQW